MRGTGQERDRTTALFYRIASSVVLVPVVALFVYFGGWPLFGLAVVITVIATNEFCTILRRAGYRPLRLFTVLLALLLVLDAQLALVGVSLPAGIAVTPVALSLAMVASLVWQLLRDRDSGEALVSWALLFAGALYIGWLLRYYLLLRWLEDGLPGLSLTVGSVPFVVERGVVWMGLVVVATWACDTAAYFVGSAWGHRRLLPHVSPRKSWEGTIAGVLAAGLVGLIGVPLLGMLPVVGLGLGLVIGVAGVLGDLAESLIKRGAQVKDASSLIPGHGGLLDRLDSMLFSGVAAYYYLILTQAVHI